MRPRHNPAGAVHLIRHSSGLLNYKDSAVHVIRMDHGYRAEAKDLNCRRCRRTLPEGQFIPVREPQCRRAIFLHPWCNTCRKQARGEYVNHPLYTPGLDRYWLKRISALSGGARTRDIVVAVTKDDLLGLHLQQGGRCALTGIEMGYSRNFKSNARFLASADRIDSDGNYTLDNIQIVCAVVNSMKNDMTDREFVEMCAAVVRHRRDTERDLLKAIA